MPGGSHPWVDTWAPAQYVFGTSGGGGPARSPDGNPMNNSSSSSYDDTLHYKLAGTIILGLAVVFILQAMGFRFVGAASVGFGRG